MSDLPWFPMYAADFLNSRKVRCMTPEEVGVYTLLLCHQWDGGPLPDDDVELANLCNGADVNTVRTVLERCFNSVQDGWMNSRLEAIRLEQIEKREQKVRAGKASGKARRGRNLPDRNTVRTALEERSNRKGTDVERTESESDKKELHTSKASFDELWQVRKRGPRAKAFDAYRRAVPSKVDHATILAGWKRHVAAAREPEFVAHLFRWIRDERWDEDVGRNGQAPKNPLHSDRLRAS